MRNTTLLPLVVAVAVGGTATWLTTRPAAGARAMAAATRITAAGPATAPAARPVINVYKSPTCGCCEKWIDHLRRHGFEVVAHDTDALEQVKAMTGIPGRLAACHTAIVDGYAIEGHVPADAIQRLLEERPAIAGLAVPGMPQGSPGMEGPRKESYDVLAFDRDGRTSVYERR